MSLLLCLNHFLDFWAEILTIFSLHFWKILITKFSFWNNWPLATGSKPCKNVQKIFKKQFRSMILDFGPMCILYFLILPQNIVQNCATSHSLAKTFETISKNFWTWFLILLRCASRTAWFWSNLLLKADQIVSRIPKLQNYESTNFFHVHSFLCDVNVNNK